MGMLITKWEKEVIVYLAQGLSSKEVAEKMSITKNAVDTFRRQLLVKTESSNTIELINFCKNEKII